MKIWTFTLTHLDMPLLTYSLEQYYSTAKPVHHAHVLLDHHWPLGYWHHRHEVLTLAERFGCKVMAPYENLGGHGAYNWLWRNLPIDPENDFVLTYDGDSNPQTPHWDNMMRIAMEDQSYAAVSLGIDAELETKEWRLHKTSSGIDVKTPASGIEMVNVTMWRASFLGFGGGESWHSPFGGPRKYYGHTEAPIFDKMRHAREAGLPWWKHGYLVNAVEKPRPFDPNPEYQKWKWEHAAGRYGENFAQWAAERGLS